MILVLLGTFTIEFKRPLIEIERLCKEGKLKEQVIVQNGHTSFQSEYLDIRPFMAPHELEELYQQADIIITHAGTGSIVRGVKLGKKVIAIPRLSSKGEHVDDHQLEILKQFSDMGYVLPWNENDNLEILLERIEQFFPKKYVSNKITIINYLKDYIDSL